MVAAVINGLTATTTTSSSTIMMAHTAAETTRRGSRSSSQQSEITAYYTANHDSPLIVLPRLGLFYLPIPPPPLLLTNDNSGSSGGGSKSSSSSGRAGYYAVRTRFGGGLSWLLEKSIMRGGDFRFEQQLPNNNNGGDGGVVAFMIMDYPLPVVVAHSAEGGGMPSLSCTVWNSIWYEFYAAVVVVQRHARRWLEMKRRRANTPSRAKMLLAFCNTDLAKTRLPLDIVDRIIEAYLLANNNNGRAPLSSIPRHIKTASYRTHRRTYYSE